MAEPRPRCLGSGPTTRAAQAATPFTSGRAAGDVLRIPVKHGEDADFADPGLLARLESNGQVMFRYCTPEGEVGPAVNPNGSVSEIAGIRNQAGNVMGLMPHPEHAVEEMIGGTDGLALLGSLVDFVVGRAQ